MDAGKAVKITIYRFHASKCQEQLVHIHVEDDGKWTVETEDHRSAVDCVKATLWEIIGFASYGGLIINNQYPFDNMSLPVEDLFNKRHRHSFFSLTKKWNKEVEKVFGSDLVWKLHTWTDVDGGNYTMTTFVSTDITDQLFFIKTVARILIEIDDTLAARLFRLPTRKALTERDQQANEWKHQVNSSDLKCLVDAVREVMASGFVFSCGNDEVEKVVNKLQHLG